MKLNGSLKSPQLKMGPLETPGELGNLSPFQLQPSCDLVKYLQTRGDEWQVSWLQHPGLQGATTSFSVAKPAVQG